MTQQATETQGIETAPEDTTTTDPPQDPPTTPEVTETGTEPRDDTEDAQPGADDAGQEGDDGQEDQGREAAKYRRKLRATERERDGLADQLTAARRQLAEQASGLQAPAGLWAAGTEVDSLFGEDGQLNREALAQATQEAVAKLGLRMGGRPPRPNPAQNGPSGGRPAVSMEAVVEGRVR